MTEPASHDGHARRALSFDTGAAVCEKQRNRLWGIAYRITGSVADAVQETWLRRQSLPDGKADDPRAYLTSVVSRICYDQLGSARA